MLTGPIRTQVLAANDAFYDAFRRMDPHDMAAHWAERDDVVCIGPMGDPWIGRDGIRDGFRDAWTDAPPWDIEVDVLSVAYEDPVATVTCREILTCGGDHPGNFEMLATNTYVLEPGGWRMVHHHASWRTSVQVEQIGA